MTIDHDIRVASQYDCGDGVPTLTILTGDREVDRPAPGGLEPRITLRTFAIAMTVLGQLAIALAIAAGGNPIVGALAAATMMGCGLVLVRAGGRSER